MFLRKKKKDKDKEEEKKPDRTSSIKESRDTSTTISQSLTTADEKMPTSDELEEMFERFLVSFQSEV